MDEKSLDFDLAAKLYDKIRRIDPSVIIDDLLCASIDEYLILRELRRKNLADKLKRAEDLIGAMNLGNTDNKLKN